MVSFVKVPPNLALETSSLTRVTAYLDKTAGTSHIRLPEKLNEMEPIGCRTLRFHGHDVALICFKRGNSQALHLFVMKEPPFRRLPPVDAPNFEQQAEWITAAWQTGDQTYLIAIQGDRSALERYLSRS